LVRRPGGGGAGVRRHRHPQGGGPGWLRRRRPSARSGATSASTGTWPEPASAATCSTGRRSRCSRSARSW
jgi:hypothetical protein